MPHPQLPPPPQCPTQVVAHRRPGMVDTTCVPVLHCGIPLLAHPLRRSASACQAQDRRHKGRLPAHVSSVWAPPASVVMVHATRSAALCGVVCRLCQWDRRFRAPAMGAHGRPQSGRWFHRVGAAVQTPGATHLNWTLLLSLPAALGHATCAGSASLPASTSSPGVQPYTAPGSSYRRV